MQCMHLQLPPTETSSPPFGSNQIPSVLCIVSILYRWKWNQLLMNVSSHHSIGKSFVSWASLLGNASPIAGKAIVKSLPPGLFILIGAPKLLLPFADWGFTTPDVFCFDCLKERCGVSEDLIDLHTNTQPCIKSFVIGTWLMLWNAVSDEDDPFKQTWWGAKVGRNWDLPSFCGVLVWGLQRWPEWGVQWWLLQTNHECNHVFKKPSQIHNQQIVTSPKSEWQMIHICGKRTHYPVGLRTTFLHPYKSIASS
jgi:hypothetical protein